MNGPQRCLAFAAVVAVLGHHALSHAAVYSNGSATAQMRVQLTILPGCTIAATPMTFNAVQGSATGPVASTSSLTVVCTASTGYNIGLNAGTVPNSTETNRLLAGTLTGNTTTIPFGLFQDASYATPWGNTQGSNTLGDSGTGVVKTYTVYGQATLSATMPAPDVYSSTVTATVYF
ncbi:Spore coat U domain-containing protein [Pandoraea captiosa]|uniref:Spore coat U domain-containing protein n=1 Tax=Pandoraea captiosa TaxID=2508302 RepID=A0A5E4ZKD7_9BURK|nr:spore coat U domain-containing protein [Pandoraea captiosa]VVE61604.1 Spore coat U domain-containing protein [Pandoraea captiosa]